MTAAPQETAESRVSPFIGDSVSEASLSHAPLIEGLTDMQSRFVWAFLLTEGNAARSAELAGYGAGEKNGIGLRNLSKKKIQDAIAQRVKLNGGVALAKAIGRLLRIVEHSPDDRAAVAAAVGLMDRFGMAPPRGPSVAVNVNNLSVTSDQAQGILAEVAARRMARLQPSGTLATMSDNRTLEHSPSTTPVIAPVVLPPVQGVGGGQDPRCHPAVRAITPQPSESDGKTAEGFFD